MITSYYAYPGLNFSLLSYKQRKAIRQSKATVNHLKILEVVCDFYGVDKANLFKRSRKRAYVWCRHVYYHLSCKLTAMTLEQIGETFGTDHTTVLHGRETVQDIIDTDPGRAEEVQRIRGKIMDQQTIGGPGK